MFTPGLLLGSLALLSSHSSLLAVSSLSPLWVPCCHACLVVVAWPLSRAGVCFASSSVVSLSPFALLLGIGCIAAPACRNVAGVLKIGSKKITHEWDQVSESPPGSPRRSWHPGCCSRRRGCLSLALVAAIIPAVIVRRGRVVSSWSTFPFLTCSPFVNNR